MLQITVIAAKYIWNDDSCFDIVLLISVHTEDMCVYLCIMVYIKYSLMHIVGFVVYV